MLRAMKKALLLVAAPLLLISLSAISAPQNPHDVPRPWMPQKGYRITLTLSTGEEVTGEVEMVGENALCVRGKRDVKTKEDLAPWRWLNPDHVVGWRLSSKVK